MGSVVDDRLGICSTLSPQQSSDLEKIQAELRQTFTAAEKFRRELEFLQKGGDPLDLKTWSAASVSVQSTSLIDQHPEQFLTSDAKGSFAVTASPDGDSVESSGRLGTPSVCEPTSADNLMLFDGDNKCRKVERRFAHPYTNNINPSERYFELGYGSAWKSSDSSALELPKKSYKRRIRSRPNRDSVRSSSTDAALSRGGQSFSPFDHASRHVKGLVTSANHERNGLSSSNSKHRGSNAAIKNVASNSHSNMEIDGVLAVETTLVRVPGPSSAASDSNLSQNSRSNQYDQLLTSNTQESSANMASVEPEVLEGVEHGNLVGSHLPPCVDTQRAKHLAFSGQINGYRTTEGERKSMPHDGNCIAAIPKKGLDSRSSCIQTGQSLDVNNGNEMPASLRNIKNNGAMEQYFASNEVPDVEVVDLVKEKEGKLLNIANNNNLNSCHWSHIEVGSVLEEEEGLKGSETAWQDELKNPVLTGVNSDGCTASERARKPNNVLGPNYRCCTDIAEQNLCRQNNLNLITKEHEDSILKEAQIIEAKRRRIAELSVGTLPPESRRKSHWDFVLEEMSWLANDFAQERLWKATAAAQISRRVAFASQIRFQQQSSLQRQKEVAQTLARAVTEFWHTCEVKCKEPELQCLKTDSKIGLQGYAMRFVEYNCDAQYSTAQPSPPPDLISDVGIVDISWEDDLTEENLFYTVPPGAIEAYRKSIESHMLQCEKTWSGMQEEVDASGYDAVADNGFEEDDGETKAYYLPGAFEGSKSSKATQKKMRNFKFCAVRAYEVLPSSRFRERNIGTQPSILSGKWSGSSLNVSIPTKRVRTASRQRVPSPFNAGTAGCIRAPNRTDASSDDTNSLPDEQITLHGGARKPNMEAESQFDSADVPGRPKKRKKARHLGSSFKRRWQPDSKFQNDQKDRSKRRLEMYQYDVNGSNVSSQMSNLSNPKKFMELLVRERGRRKVFKIPAAPPSSKIPWSLFEDQALVVLVHDMGPNWELISDAFNSNLQFQCIFRKPTECKERHRMLMATTGDGADSAEDSGSSQPYPSTLPGIPEGSARQLFQRLQGPIEEETLKSHFEKILKIGQNQYSKRTQNDTQDSKGREPHESHTLALAQACPNNLNGGPTLTPLDLCDAIAPSPDVPPVGHQGPQGGDIPIANQGNGAAMPPGAGSSSSAPVSSNVVRGNNSSSASAPPNPSVRDGRLGIPQTGPLSRDNQQRRQQYSQTLPVRNLPQSSLPAESRPVTDRGVRVLPVANGIGVMPGMNRNMSMARPAFQGVASPSMLNSSSVVSSGQGNAMLRPRDALHMMRPNQNNHQVQIRPADLQMQQQVSQGGSSQAVPQFASGMRPSFPNQAVPQPPMPPFPLHHHQQSHPVSAQRPPPMLGGNPPNSSFGMRFVKERQLQQRLLQQRLVPIAQNVPNQPLAAPPQPPPHGFVRNPQTGGNPIARPQLHRQPQQFPQRQPLKSGQGNVHSGPLHQQKTSSSQTKSANGSNQNHPPPAVAAASSGAPPPVIAAANPLHPPPPQPHPKLVNLSRATPPQRMVNSSQASKTSGGGGASGEHAGPAVNQSVVQRKSSLDSLPDSAGGGDGGSGGGGTEWRQPPSS